MQMLQAKLRTPVFPITDYPLEPLFRKQQDWASRTANTLSQLYQSVKGVAKASEGFDRLDPQSAINSRKAISSYRTHAAAVALGKAKPASYSLTIDKLAAAQTNEGNRLNSSAPTGVQAGTNTFAITINEKEHTLSFFSLSADTNEISLKRMAETINREKLGVAARVVYDRETGTSHLHLMSEATGEQHAFSLRDIAGNSVQITGAGIVAIAASDALYTVDGQNFRSTSNQVRIGQSAEVLLTLLKPTDEAMRIEVIPDKEKIMAQAKELLAQINRMSDFLRQHTADLAVDLHGSFQRILRNSRSHFERIGIAVHADGSLQIDEEQLSKLIDENFAAVERGFGGSSGLATRFGSKAEQLLATPLGSFSAAAPGPYQSSYLSSMFFQQAARTGLFYNQLF